MSRVIIFLISSRLIIQIFNLDVQGISRRFEPRAAIKVIHGKPVRLSNSQLNKGHAHYFHPEN
ncbi:hypothetical protein Plhal304r1_c064g0152171 [Plasmopara halstedii]